MTKRMSRKPFSFGRLSLIFAGVFLGLWILRGLTIITFLPGIYLLILFLLCLICGMISLWQHRR
ncbi:MAG: hypothetical protein ACRC2J_02605 [Microcoleaceae cyanobacterium]